jgi:threonine aldolase
MAPQYTQVKWQKPPRLDFRYEVTHKPTAEMWEAMMAVDLGMASAGEDPTVNELEGMTATLTGQEAALFLPTTTNGTVLTFLTNDLRGQQAIMEARCHIFWVERLHITHLSGIAPRLIRGDKFGALGEDEIEETIEESAYGRTIPTAMLCLENTHNVYGGTVLTQAYMESVSELARRRGVRVFLDGARVINAAVAQRVPVRALTSPADYLVVSLNKGLGAPLGALLCGRKEFIEQARIAAARLGIRAIHKAGLFAAAGIVALEKMVGGLAADHERARRLAVGLSTIDGLSVDLETVQTNLVRVGTKPSGAKALSLAHQFAERGLAVHVVEPYAFKMALCYALGDESVDEAIDITKSVMGSLPGFI